MQARPQGGGAKLGRAALLAWNDSSVLAVALVALAAGFGQFGAVAALGGVAKTFGHITTGESISARAGLSAGTLGVGLAIIRLASLGGMPLAGLADRLGRRSTMLVTCAAGLLLTAAAALSPSYWWFVAIFALGRPMLSATNALSEVQAGELTSSGGRAKAVALVTAGYGVGAGLIAVIYSLARSSLGFRGVFALCMVPLMLIAIVRNRVPEPERFKERRRLGGPAIRPVRGPLGRRLGCVCLLGFALSVITGPANSFVFLYAQNIEHVSGALTAAMVAMAGPSGLVGLLLGRWMADTIGRRPSIVVAMSALALFGVLVYSGGTAPLVIGYVLGIFAGGLIAPALGAFLNEIFPTSIRASAAGWYIAAGVVGATAGLVVFGVVSTAENNLSVAALLTFLPALPALVVLRWLPESRGKEPEDLSGEGPEPHLAQEPTAREVAPR
ncbi:MAG: MFS transporter [Acidimicrobiales bacterium]